MNKRLGIFLALILMALSGRADGQRPGANAGMPHLEKRGSATQLMVDGKPFLVL